MTATRSKLGTASFLLVLSTMIFAFAGAVAIPVAESATSFKFIEAGKLLRVASTQGYSSTSKNLYFTSYSRSGTGNINDFANVKLGSTGYVMPRLGWCSDTGGSNLTLTVLKVNEVTYTVDAAGTQRIWCPDRGQPSEVTGEDTLSWDAGNQVLTTTTAGAGSVTLRWYSSTSLGFFESAQILMSFLPFVIVLMVVGAAKYPDYRGTLITLAIVGGFLVLMANLIYAWGL